jgi:hypothetical protein
VNYLRERFRLTSEEIVIKAKKAFERKNKKTQ